MTLEQAGAVVVIALFAVFIAWGRTRGGGETIGRVFGSRGREKIVTGGSKRSGSRKDGRATKPDSKRSSGKRRAG